VQPLYVGGAHGQGVPFFVQHYLNIIDLLCDQATVEENSTREVIDLQSHALGHCDNTEQVVDNLNLKDNSFKSVSFQKHSNNLVCNLDSSKFSQGKNLSSKNNSGDIKVIKVNNVEQCVNASQVKGLNLLDNDALCVKGHSSTIDHNLQKCLKSFN
jgi:hypothetical protein